MFKKKKENTVASTPVVEEIVTSDTNIELETEEEKFKSDGSIVIGAIDENNEIVATNAPLPEQIDIEARKKEILMAQELKKKKGKVEMSKEAKKVQTIVALIVLTLFGAVGGIFYYYKNYANNKDFSVKKVHVEYGSPASLAIATYVNVTDPDEKQYTLDLSEFIPDEIGEYTYKISYSGVVKTGVIEVSDTSEPIVKVKDVVIKPGETYTPNMFIDKCVDLNDCYVTFEDGTTIQTATEAGEENVYLNVKDKIGNQTTVKATLKVISTEVTYNCSNSNPFNYDLGYKQTTRYEIVYDKNLNYLTSKEYTIYEYIDQNEYLKYKENHQAESYSYDDALSKVTHKKNNEAGFGENKDYESITKYLSNNKFTCTLKTDN